MAKIILSIDGGGIKGLIPLCVLEKLEKQTGKSAREVIQFCGGTSTGSIITGGIATGIPATEMINLYLKLGPKVFRENWIRWLLRRGWYRYESKPLNDLIKEAIGEVILNELPMDVLITAVRIQDAHLWWLVKDNPGNAKMTGNLQLADCITASSAVPIYFRPWHLPTIGDCVDGGASFATNPVYRTAIEAFDYTSGKYIPTDTIVVSLGTGHYPGPFTPKSIFPMLGFTISAVLGTTAELQTELVRKFYHPLALYRIDIELKTDIGMDEFSASDKLVEYGKELASQVDWSSILEGGDNRWLVNKS